MNDINQHIETDKIFIQDKNGAEICFGSVVEFEFKNLMETSFIQSNFGKLIAKTKVDRCFIHFHDARNFQPHYNWYKTLCYVVYFLKDNKLFTIKEEAIMNEEPFDETDTDTFFLYDFNPRFLIYLRAKNSFNILQHSNESQLSEDYLKNL